MCRRLSDDCSRSLIHVRTLSFDPFIIFYQAVSDGWHPFGFITHHVIPTARFKGALAYGASGACALRSYRIHSTPTRITFRRGGRRVGGTRVRVAGHVLRRFHRATVLQETGDAGRPRSGGDVTVGVSVGIDAEAESDRCLSRCSG